MEILGYKAKANIRACVTFEKLAGKTIDQMGGITDMMLLVRSMVIAGEGKEPKDLEDKLLDLDINQLAEVASQMTIFQGANQQAEGLPDSSGGDPAK